MLVQAAQEIGTPKVRLELDLEDEINSIGEVHEVSVLARLTQEERWQRLKHEVKDEEEGGAERPAGWRRLRGKCRVEKRTLGKTYQQEIEAERPAGWRRLRGKQKVEKRTPAGDRGGPRG